MEYYQIWLIAAIILIIVEIFTAGFGVICFAIGALFSALTSYLGGSVVWQLVVFAAASMLAFFFLRPVIIKILDRKSKDIKTNAEALVGRVGVVSETIDNAHNTGRVAVDGDDWKAVSDDGSVIGKGQKVDILSLDSIILTVKLHPSDI